MLYILIANIISMVIGLFNSFMLPKFLSIETYAIVKTYNLYITYAVFLCFGYNEGMYLKYGGKNLGDISKKDLAGNLMNFIYLEISALLLMILAGALTHNDLITAFAVGMFGFNIITYLKSLYQATGEFAQYGKALNFEKISIFLLNIVLLFIMKTDCWYFYVGVQVIAEIIVAGYLIFSLKKRIGLPLNLRLSLKEMRQSIGDGFVLMIGNFSSSIFVGLDRWYVKFLLTSVHFAYYSFAASIESLINVFVTPITISLYNTFCKGIDREKIHVMKNAILIWCYAIIAVAFPIKWIVQVYLDKYMNSLQVIFILLAAQPFYGVIKGIYVNLYKAQKKQNYYMKQMLEMIGIAAVLNTAMFLLYKEMVSIALATLLTSIIWLIVCEKKENYRFSLKEALAIIIYTITYLACGQLSNPFLGMLIYIAVCLVTGSICMKEAMLYMWKLGMEKISGKTERKN